MMTPEQQARQRLMPFIHRLIKHGGARSILFLVDRTSLGDQTLREF
jgi:type I site-specific restriction endonuclease